MLADVQRIRKEQLDSIIEIMLICKTHKELHTLCQDAEEALDSLADSIRATFPSALDEFLKDELGDDAHLFTSDGKNHD